MKSPPDAGEIRAVSHAASRVLIAVAFICLWLHFGYVHARWHGLGWRIYSLYFAALAAVAGRYLTGVRHGHRWWHRVVFDGLTLLFIAIGVHWTGGVSSDLWLVYLIYVIAETLAASRWDFVITDGVAIASYVAATWPRQPTWTYAEQLGTRFFFLVLIASIARSIAAQQRRRDADLGALREALSVSEERRRLARELHDSVGHGLTRAILGLEVARRQLPREPQPAGEEIARAIGTLRGAMDEMRQLVATLRTDTAPFDLPGWLRATAADMAVSMEIALLLPDEPLPLSGQQQYQLARVIQEALTNCLRHAQVTRAEVEVRVARAGARGKPGGGSSQVIATIRDAGPGFHPETVCEGQGLKGMAERLAPYGGKVWIEAAPGAGTRITASLPLDSPGHVGN